MSGWLALAEGAKELGGAFLNDYFDRKAFGRSAAFSREQMQNAHQWEVADLRAAGLNPILSAGGSGAKGGSVSQPRTVSKMNSVLASLQAAENIELTRAQVKESSAKAMLLDQQAITEQDKQFDTAASTALKKSQQKKVMEEAKKISASAFIEDKKREGLETIEGFLMDMLKPTTAKQYNRELQNLRTGK